jgi:hypothetical protein
MMLIKHVMLALSVLFFLAQFPYLLWKCSFYKISTTTSHFLIGVEWHRVRLLRRPVFGLLYQPRWWTISVEQSVEQLARETEVFSENLPECQFVYHKSHISWPCPKPGTPLLEAGAYPPEPGHNIIHSLNSTFLQDMTPCGFCKNRRSGGK